MYHVVCTITPHFENRPLIEFPLLRLWITTQTSFGFLINTPTSGFPEKKFPPAKISVWLAPDSTCSDILYTGNPFLGMRSAGMGIVGIGIVGMGTAEKGFARGQNGNGGVGTGRM